MIRKRRSAWSAMMSLAMATTVAAMLATGALAENQNDRGVKIGNARVYGYGDLHYNSPRGEDFPDSTLSDQADAHRFVIGVEYNWTDDLWLEAEVDFEHAAKDMELEFAQVSWKHSDAFGLRGGVVLMPVGPLNEHHEPTTYYSVERPQMDRFIIPTSWQEMGAGAFGHFSAPVPIDYTLYATANLNPSGFSADRGIRNGRGEVDEQPTTGAAIVGRVSVSPILGLTLGASGYHGTSSTEKTPILLSIGVDLWAFDAKWTHGPFELLGRYATLHIDHSADVTANNGGQADPVAERSTGWLAEGAIHTGQWLFPDSERDLVGFVRWQNIDTQDKIDPSAVRDATRDRDILTGGLAFYPHHDVVLKADVEHWKIGTGADANRYNLGIGFIY